jgi:sortase family protein
MRERAWATRAAAILLLTVVAGCGQNAGAGSSAPPADTAAAPGPAASSGAPSTTNVRARSTPVALDVPAIGVHTTGLVDLGLTPSGALDVPKDAATAGWFALSPVPGEVGPAVLAAHVDYDKVPGVFARLREMKVGDTAEVTRSDGATVRFAAYRVERFSKSAFPTAEVYGNTDGPELRLVTCGGEFDGASRHYRDNVVVFARLT